MTYAEQLHTVHQVAAHYWRRDLSQVANALSAIEVIKQNPGKMMGFFPHYEHFPEVFFKVYFNNAFQYEMRGLQTVQAMPEMPGIKKPSAVQVMPEYKAILTEKRYWDDTTTPIKRFFVGSLGIDWGTVGRWLRAFHDSQVSQTPNEKFIRRKFEKIEAHLEALQTLFTPEQMDTMRGIIEQVRDYFATEPTEWVISHGDFGLDNIKKADDMLEIIDFEDCQMAPREFDILNCLVRLEYVNCFPNIPGTFNQIRNDFLNGYGLLPERTTCNDFTYLLVKLDAIETYYRRRKNDFQTSKNALIYSYFENQVKGKLIRWLTTKD